MGKSKSRIFRKGIGDQIQKISRSDAILNTVKYLETAELNRAKDIITMFGLSAEELLESGASYESIKAIKNIFNNE